MLKGNLYGFSRGLKQAVMMTYYVGDAIVLQQPHATSDIGGGT